jgi:hypothetical protein
VLLALARRGLPVRRQWALATAAVLAGVLALSFAQGVAGLLASAALWGFGSGAMWIATTTQVRQIAPDALSVTPAAAWLAVALGGMAWLAVALEGRRARQSPIR